MTNEQHQELSAKLKSMTCDKLDELLQSIKKDIELFEDAENQLAKARNAIKLFVAGIEYTVPELYAKFKDELETKGLDIVVKCDTPKNMPEKLAQKIAFACVGNYKNLLDARQAYEMCGDELEIKFSAN